MENGSCFSEEETFCCLCRQAVDEKDIFSHVAWTHLEEERLDEKGVCCGYCDFATTWSAEKVRSHMDTAHRGQPVKILDKRNGYVENVYSLVQRCFPATEVKKRKEEDYELGGVENSKREVGLRFRLDGPNPEGDEMKGTEPGLESSSAFETDKAMRHSVNETVKNQQPTFKNDTSNDDVDDGNVPARHSATAVVLRTSILRWPGKEVGGEEGKNSEEDGDCEETVKQNKRKKTVDNMDDQMEAVGIKKKQLTSGSDFDSNSMPTVKQWTCQICQNVVREQRKRHVVVHHLKKPVWVCPYCNYSNVRYKEPVCRHIRQFHPGKQIHCIDKRSEYEEEIKQLMTLAFPNGLQLESVFPQDGSVEEEHLLRVATRKAQHKGKERQKLSLPKRKSNPGIKKKQRCKICKEVCTQRQFERHVLVHHLKKPVWFCPYCEYSNVGYKTNLKNHILRWHPEKPMSYVDRRWDHANEIKELMVEAFQCPKLQLSFGVAQNSGNARKAEVGNVEDEEVKLLKNDAQKGGTPCKICEKTVRGRGSNRRYHVLTNHLKKPILGCPYCPYTNYGHKDNLKLHVTSNHPQQKFYQIDNTTVFQQEINEWVEACFPAVPVEIDRKSSENLEMGEGNRTEKVKVGSRCKLCRETTSCGSRQSRISHVQRKHVKKQMYFCPLCDYSDICKGRKMFKKHFDNVHPDKEVVEIVDRFDEHKEQIEKMLVECFSQKQLPDVFQDGMEALEKFAKNWEEDEAAEVITEENGMEGEEKGMYCRECQREVSVESLERHVYHVHIRKLTVFCPHCDFGALYDPEEVEFHIRVVHVGEDVRVVDKRGEMKEEFERAKNQLFSIEG